MIVGDNYYQWESNHIKYKDPETGAYSGSVIGNTPLEESLSVVEAAGEQKKQLIRDRGAELVEELVLPKQPYIDFWRVIESVESEIMAYPWPSAN